MKQLKFFLCLITVLVSQQITALTNVKGIRVWPAPDNTRVVLDLSKKAKYSVSTLSSPDRIVIDLADARFSAKIAGLPLTNTGIKIIRYGVHTDNKIRIVLELNKKLKHNAFILAPNERYGHRLVVDLEPYLTQPAPTPPKRIAKPETVSVTRSPHFIIAIDAGHGGDDPGAIGPRGTKEKDVALAIARQLKEVVDAHPNMTAVLIRNGDYYLGFRERMRRARAKNADLLISIHADAFMNAKADGASVFTLSSNKHSSVAARWLVASENRADLVGGVSISDKGDMVGNVIFDLTQTANSVASVEAAKHILHSMGKHGSLHRGKVESGAFLVLRSPDIPSVLVEAGFISNPKMELKLRSKQYQRAVALAIADGAKQYFRTNPRHFVSKR